MSITDIISDYSINDITNASNTTTTDLDKNAFLNLLVTQLKYQDPLDPVKNEDFLAQLAQFSSLEQMTSMNTNFSSLLYTQQVAQATSLIGSTVTYVDSDSTVVSGVAESVVIYNSTPYLKVGEDAVPLDGVLSYTQGTNGNLLSEASMLIGKQVSWTDTSTSTVKSDEVISAEIEDGVVVLNLSGGSSIKFSEVTAVSNVS